LFFEVEKRYEGIQRRGKIIEIPINWESIPVSINDERNPRVLNLCASTDMRKKAENAPRRT
jgi:hypothetical protein